MDSDSETSCYCWDRLHAWYTSHITLWLDIWYVCIHIIHLLNKMSKEIKMMVHVVMTYGSGCTLQRVPTLGIGLQAATGMYVMDWVARCNGYVRYGSGCTPQHKHIYGIELHAATSSWTSRVPHGSWLRGIALNMCAQIWTVGQCNAFHLHGISYHCIAYSWNSWLLIYLSCCLFCLVRIWRFDGLAD